MRYGLSGFIQQRGVAHSRTDAGAELLRVAHMSLATKIVWLRGWSWLCKRPKEAGAMKRARLRKYLPKEIVMIDKTNELYPVVIHEMTPDEYTISVLKDNNQDEGSYIEVVIKEGHSMYQRIRDIVGALNVAGPESSIEGIGEAYQTGVYSSFFDSEEYKQVLGEK